MNWLIVAGIILVFVYQIISIINYEQYNPRPAPQSIQQQMEQEEGMPGPIGQFVLNGWGIKGLFGHMWLHGGILHVVGNLLFLWIFGNAVCAKIGNFRYFPIYIGLGLVAAISHLIFSGGPMIGASGAINGIVGMFLVFFPQNEITVYLVGWFVLLPRVWEFSLSSYWMILFWFTFDVLGAFLGGGQVAYFAHVGGFLAGFALAVVMLKTKVVVMEPRYEKSLLDIIDEWRHPPEPEPDTSLSDFRRDMEFAEELERKSHPSAVAIPPAAVMPPARTSSHEPDRLITLDPAPKEEFIRFVCSCGKKVKIPAKFAGKSGRCPACKKQIKIPELFEPD